MNQTKFYPTVIPIVFILLLINSFVSHAQLKGAPEARQSPNTEGVGIVNEIPVSHFSGTTAISIPLYELKGKSISVPITLNYYTSGIKPEQHPGWVGTGWNLRAGGMIARSIRGYPDEHKSDTKTYGYYYHRDSLAKSGWKDYAKNPDRPFDTSHRIDLQPDEFSFSFLNYSGKFFLDTDGNWQVQSDKKLKVSFQGFASPFVLRKYGKETAISQAFMSFVITDEEGNRFIFGSDESAIEYSEPIERSLYAYENTGANFFATAWYLNRIETADKKDFIEFSYYRGPFIAQVSKYALKDDTKINGNTCSNPNNDKTNGTWQDRGYFVSPVYLARISQSGGITVGFQVSPCTDLRFPTEYFTRIGSRCTELLTNDFASVFTDYIKPMSNQLLWLKLDRIAVWCGKTYHKQILFKYNNVTTERLFLDSLRITGTINKYEEAEQKYRFTYKERSKLPSYLKTYADHWGYNNGVNIDGQKLDINTIYSNKAPDVSGKVFYGILDTVVNPDGGRTILEFEQHDYSKVISLKDRKQILSETGIAGGVRIKKITYRPEQGNDITREYVYKTDYPNLGTAAPSSGILNIKPVYGISNVQATSTSGMNKGKTFTSTLTESIATQLLKDDELPVGYTDVTEIIRPATGETQFIRYQYTNHDNGYTDDNAVDLYNRQIALYNPYNSRSFERGKLLEKQVYNGKKKLVQSLKNEWKKDNTGKNTIRALLNDTLVVSTVQNPGSYYYYNSSVAYYNYTEPLSLVSQQQTTYNEGSTEPMIVTTNFTYDPVCRQVKEIITTGSKQQAIRQTFTYPFDYKGVSVYDDMVKKNMISIPIEQVSYVGTKEVSHARTNYASWNNNRFFAPASLEKSHDGKPLETVMNFLGYDYYGNLQESIGKNGIRNTVLWGYGWRYPIAIIAGADKNDALAGLSDGFLNSGETGYPQGYTNELIKILDKIRSNVPNAQVTTITYSPGIGKTSETDINGTTTKYEYDTWGRLSFVKDHNGNILQKYCYSYDGQPVDCGAKQYFYSKARSQTFTRNNCLTKLPVSTIKQAMDFADISKKLEVELYADGSGYKLFSEFYPDMHNPDRFKTPRSYSAIITPWTYPATYPVKILPSGYYGETEPFHGTPVTYAIPEAAYRSSVSQDAADRKATEDIIQYGQFYANTKGFCLSPGYEQSGLPLMDRATGVYHFNDFVNYQSGGWEMFGFLGEGYIFGNKADEKKFVTYEATRKATEFFIDNYIFSNYFSNPAPTFHNLVILNNTAKGTRNRTGFTIILSSTNLFGGDRFRIDIDIDTDVYICNLPLGSYYMEIESSDIGWSIEDQLCIDGCRGYSVNINNEGARACSKLGSYLYFSTPSKYAGIQTSTTILQTILDINTVTSGSCTDWRSFYINGDHAIKYTGE